MKKFAFSMLLLASISYTGIACSSSDEETTDGGTENTDTGKSDQVLTRVFFLRWEDGRNLKPKMYRLILTMTECPMCGRINII